MDDTTPTKICWPGFMRTIAALRPSATISQLAAIRRLRRSINAIGLGMLPIGSVGIITVRILAYDTLGCKPTHFQCRNRTSPVRFPLHAGPTINGYGLPQHPHFGT